MLEIPDVGRVKKVREHNSLHGSSCEENLYRMIRKAQPFPGTCRAKRLCTSVLLALRHVEASFWRRPYGHVQ